MCVVHYLSIRSTNKITELLPPSSGGGLINFAAPLHGVVYLCVHFNQSLLFVCTNIHTTLPFKAGCAPCTKHTPGLMCKTEHKSRALRQIEITLQNLAADSDFHVLHVVVFYLRKNMDIFVVK